MSSVFQFKQFSVDQSNCAMKINTDGVLLGALAEAIEPARILDIGTGTGVIALMLAQRFADAYVDALEIDLASAATATRNFETSNFSSRLRTYPISFQEYFASNSLKYDLIVSNPPFFLNSLKNRDARKEQARHADEDFFVELIIQSAQHLTEGGTICIIIPADITEKIIDIANAKNLFLSKNIAVKSFSQSHEHRNILNFNFAKQNLCNEYFVIYESEKKYSEQYQSALAAFLTIF